MGTDFDEFDGGGFVPCLAGTLELSTSAFANLKLVHVEIIPRNNTAAVFMT